MEQSRSLEAGRVFGYLRSNAYALPLERGGSYRVGRKLDCELVLKSRSVSGEHATLEVDEQGRQVVLRDLSSLNGCFVNNVRLKGQREVLAHGDNVRFGFEQGVWTVDCTSREQAPRPTPGGAGWQYAPGGAAVGAEPAEQFEPARRRLPQLSSGATPLEGFFANHDAIAAPRSPSQELPPPSPPEEALRTSESGYADAAARPRPGIADFDVTPHEGDGEDAFGEQRPPSGRVAGRKGEQRRGERRGGRGDGAGGGSSGGGVSGSWREAPDVHQPGDQRSRSAPTAGAGTADDAAGRAEEEELLRRLIARARRSAATLHARLLRRGVTSAPLATEAAANRGESPTVQLRDLVGALQMCERLADAGSGEGGAGAGGRGGGGYGGGAAAASDGTAVSLRDTQQIGRLARLVVQQQQQLAALRVRLARREKQILSLAKRDGGKALLLAEQEAASAQRAARKKDHEVASLQRALAQLDYTAARQRLHPAGPLDAATGISAAGGDRSSAAMLSGGGGGGAGGKLPLELQKFVIEHARETAALRVQLALHEGGAREAHREWGALEHEKSVVERQCELLRADVAAVASQLEAAQAEAAERLNAAEAAHEARLAEYAAVKAAGGNGRAKAAEFVVERLKQSRERVATLEKELAARPSAPALAASTATPFGMAAAGSGMAPSVSASAELARLRRAEDELKELRASKISDQLAQSHEVCLHLPHWRRVRARASCNPLARSHPTLPPHPPHCHTHPHMRARERERERKREREREIEREKKKRSEKVTFVALRRHQAKATRLVRQLRY